MTTDTIKLKIKEQSKTTNACKEIKEAFINSCLQLDPSIFEPYIDEDRYFQELDKYRFLQSMESTFSKHKHANQVSLKPGKCNCCNLGMGTLDFYDQQGYHLFSYIISEENGLIDDIFICNLSTGSRHQNYENLLSIASGADEKELNEAIDEWMKNVERRNNG